MGGGQEEKAAILNALCALERAKGVVVYTGTKSGTNGLSDKGSDRAFQAEGLSHLSALIDTVSYI